MWLQQLRYMNNIYDKVNIFVCKLSSMPKTAMIIQ